jgi:hypothetical protein
MFATRGRVGVSKLAVPVVIIVVLVVSGAYIFLARGSTNTPTQSSSTTSQPTVPLRTVVDQFIQDINQRNVDGVVAFYGQNSLVVWSGRTGGLVGQYSGPSNVRLIYAASVGKTTKMDVNISDYAERVFSPTNVNATFVIKMLGNSTVAGTLNATVDVTQEWQWNGAGWQISKENWAYKYFDASLIDANLGSATTFPQWGYMQKGGNPNLVSEKSFEWHAAPLLAAGLYAFLFGIVFVMALRLRSRGRAVLPGEDGGPSFAEQRTGPESRKPRRGSS